MSAPPINAAVILLVPVRECDENVRSLNGIGRLRVASRADQPRSGYLPVLREQVRARLEHALTLLPNSLGLEIIAAYRSVELPHRLFANRERKVRRLNPGLSEEEVYARTTEFVSDPTVYSPHTTGGAVDVVLIDRQGRPLDLGELRHNSRAWTDSEAIPPEQRGNRRLLIEAMSGAGFVNYPREWWHWSYGDRYWAYTTGAPHAIYDHIAYAPATHLAARAARLVKRLLRPRPG